MKKTIRLDRQNKRFVYRYDDTRHVQRYEKVWIPLGYRGACFEKQRAKKQDSMYFSITRNSLLNGNTLLFQLPDYSFMFVNEHGKMFVFRLQFGDFIVKFVSLVGKNNISYPVIIGKWYFYFLKYKTRVRKHHYKKIDCTSLPDMLLLYHYYYKYMRHRHIRHIASI